MTAFDFFRVTHRRLQDSTYGLLDVPPKWTDVLIVTADDVLWFQVVNPEEGDNAQRQYTLTSARANHDAAKTGQP